VVITAIGFVYCWDFERNRSIVNRRSLSEIIENSSQLREITFASSGLPILSTVDGRSFTFSKEFDTWTLLSDKASPLFRYSELCNNNGETSGGGEQLNRLISAETGGRLPLTTDVVTRIACTQALLEQKLLAARVFGCPRQFRLAMNDLVQRLCRDGALTKLESLLTPLVTADSTAQLCGLWQRRLVAELVEYLDREPKLSELARRLRAGLNSELFSCSG